MALKASMSSPVSSSRPVSWTRASKLPSAKRRAAAAMSRMGLVCCMAVVAEATKAMSSTVMEVMPKMPMKAPHISVMALGSAIASTGPTSTPSWVDRAGTATTKRALS